MATTTKKAATKKPATRKTTAKATKASIKPKAAVKASTKKQKVVEEQSFRPTKDTTPFMTFKFTRQSLYWLILSVLVLVLGAWVMYLDTKIQDIYDQVELNTYLHETYTIPDHEKKVQTPQQ